MQLSVTFRHMDPSDQLKDYSRDKLLRLEKYLDAVIDAEVVFSVEKFRHKVEVLVTSDGLKIKADEENDDMYSAIDLVVDKLERQIKKQREKLKSRKTDGDKRVARPHGAPEKPRRDDDDDEDDEVTVDRHISVKPKLMGVHEAAATLARGAAGSQVVFVNSEDDCLSILRQAPGGQLELTTIQE